jgi:hypothetical protein
MILNVEGVETVPVWASNKMSKEDLSEEIGKTCSLWL